MYGHEQAPAAMGQASELSTLLHDGSLATLSALMVFFAASIRQTDRQSPHLAPQYEHTIRR